MIEVTNHTIACFIERDSWVKSIYKCLIGEWIKAVKNSALTDKRDYSSYITIEVVSASNQEDKVWEAVLRSEHIWCQSFFIGESARLFCKMLDLSKANGVKNKIFFDLADRSEAIYHLMSFDRGAEYSMRWLANHNNIKFLFWDEILEMTQGYSFQLNQPIEM